MSVSLEVSEYIAVVRLDKPPVNALDRTTRRRLIEVFDEISERDDIRVAILRLRNMTAIDATGLLALEDLADKLHTTGRSLILCGARPQPARLMRQVEFERHVGRENVCPHIAAALERAEAVHGRPAGTAPAGEAAS